MCRFSLLAIFYFIFSQGPDISGIAPAINCQSVVSLNHQDTLKDNQILYNGRIWRNLYYMIEGDQFLFSREFLPGSISISGKTFTGLYLKYDIYKDEILIPADPGGILQLNKELVDSFSLFFQNKSFLFVSMQDDSLKVSKSYYNVIYKGKSSLYLKYRKKIDKLSVVGEYDRFYQLTSIYFIKDNIVYPIDSKRALLKILGEDEQAIRNFIKKNKLDISVDEPESFIPVIRYYDTVVH